MSPRSQISSIIDGATNRIHPRRVPPLRHPASAAVVGVLLIGCLVQQQGPGTSQSHASPSPSVAPTATSPSHSPTPSATLEPTPAPTAAWTGLDWSAGVVPFASGTSWISEIQPWEGGYVAVGGTFPLGQGTVFHSTDGQHWTIAFQAKLPDGWSFEYLVPLTGGLLAVSDRRGVACVTGAPCPPPGFDLTPRLWYSSDGSSWKQIDSPSWRQVLGASLPYDIVGGAAGVVGIRADGTVVHSADGRNWRSATLPAVATALPGRPMVPGALTAFAGGFVVVGRDGSPDPYSQVVESPLPPGVGRPAAWFSRNGIDWAQAVVPGQMVPGGELREVAAGANGLFAVGIGEAVDTQTHPVTHGWASKDGMTWTLVGRVGRDVPLIGGRLLAQGLLVGDGTMMAIFGATSATSTAAVASVSVDGVEWQPLKFSGTPTDFLVGTWNQAGPQGHHYLTRATVVPGGVIAQVFSGQPEFWFGTGVTDGE